MFVCVNSYQYFTSKCDHTKKYKYANTSENFTKFL